VSIGFQKIAQLVSHAGKYMAEKNRELAGTKRMLAESVAEVNSALERAAEINIDLANKIGLAEKERRETETVTQKMVEERTKASKAAQILEKIRAGGTEQSNFMKKQHEEMAEQMAELIALAGTTKIPVPVPVSVLIPVSFIFLVGWLFGLLVYW